MDPAPLWSTQYPDLQEWAAKAKSSRDQTIGVEVGQEMEYAVQDVRDVCSFEKSAKILSYNKQTFT